MASVTLERATKAFGGVTAVRDMSLQIEDGSFVAFLGPSGCGKTTTMNMIAGLEGVTSGRIRFDGRDVTAVPVARRGVGFVFQNYAVFTHMSVRDNLAFGLEVRRLPRAEVDRRVAAMAEFMALTHRLGQRASTLSVNELQKLAIGRSAIVEPAIFLLDEPLSNLDAAFRERMREELRLLQRRLKQTMVYVTHDQVEAMGLADRIAVMNRATLQQFDTPEGVHDRPANVFVAHFIGTPGMNVIPARLAEEGGAVHLGGRSDARVALGEGLVAAARGAGPAVLLGVRPQDLRLHPPGGDAVAAGVALVETVGRRRVVHLQTGAGPLVATVGREVALRAGETVGVTVDAARAHLFDPETTRRLAPPEEARHG